MGDALRGIVGQTQPPTGGAGPVDPGLQPTGLSMLSSLIPGATPPTGATAAPTPVPATPTQAAAPSQAPIDVVGDRWQPKGESFLGKIGDVLMMLDGQRPIFHDRTVMANERSALANYNANDPASVQLAAKRLEMVPGADPSLGMQAQEQAARANFYNATGQARKDAVQDRVLQAMTNGANGLMQLYKDHPDQVAQIYPKFREQMLALGGPDYGNLNQDFLDKNLPEEFDPDKMNTLANEGISVSDQYRVQNETAHTQLEAANVGSMIQARTASIGQRGQEIEQKGQELKLRADEYNETVRRDQQNNARLNGALVDQTMANAARMYPPVKNDDGTVTPGISLNSVWAPYVTLKPNQMVVSPDKTQVILKKSDGLIYKYPLVRNEKTGKLQIPDTARPIAFGTTISGYLDR